MNNTELTDEQVENWRKVLCVTLGPYALICSKQDIQNIRDKMQRKIDEEETNFIHKSLSDLCGDKKMPKPKIEPKGLSFGDLLKEAQNKGKAQSL